MSTCSKKNCKLWGTNLWETVEKQGPSRTWQNYMEKADAPEHSIQAQNAGSDGCMVVNAGMMCWVVDTRKGRCLAYEYASLRHTSVQQTAPYIARPPCFCMKCIWQHWTVRSATLIFQTPGPRRCASATPGLVCIDGSSAASSLESGSN